MKDFKIIIIYIFLIQFAIISLLINVWKMNLYKGSESSEERKKRFKELSSDERRKIIRIKLKMQGLKEGSGVNEKDQTPYDKEEIVDLILITSCFKKDKIK